MTGWVYKIQKVQHIPPASSYSISGESTNDEEGITVKWQCEIDLYSMHVTSQDFITEMHYGSTNLNKCIKSYFNKRRRFNLTFNKIKEIEENAVYHDIEGGAVFRAS